MLQFDTNLKCTNHHRLTTESDLISTNIVKSGVTFNNQYFLDIECEQNSSDKDIKIQVTKNLTFLSYNR